MPTRREIHFKLTIWDSNDPVLTPHYKEGTVVCSNEGGAIEALQYLVIKAIKEMKLCGPEK